MPPSGSQAPPSDCGSGPSRYAGRGTPAAAAAGVQPTQIRFRVYIHETADVAAAEQFWATITNTDPGAFYKAVFKRHNPQTVRKNVDADYHGCLRIDVLQSADLYRRIEGWARAAMRGAA